MFRLFKNIFKKRNKQESPVEPLTTEHIRSMFRYEDFIGQTGLKIKCCTFGLIRTERESIETEQTVYITSVNLSLNSMRLIVDMNRSQDIMTRYMKLWSDETSKDSSFPGITLNMDDIFMFRNVKLCYMYMMEDPKTLSRKCVIDIDTGQGTFSRYGKEINRIENEIQSYKRIIQTINNTLLNDQLFLHSDLNMYLSSKKNDISVYIKDRRLFGEILEYSRKQIKRLNKEKSLYIK